MDPVSAGKIGLLPATLVKKVKPVGNAAGEGAKIALVNEKEMQMCIRDRLYAGVTRRLSDSRGINNFFENIAFTTC